MHKKSCFRRPFGSQDVNGHQTLLESAQEQFYPTFSSFGDKLGQKNSLLVRSEILGLFVNTLTADHRYSGDNRENLSQPFQMRLFQKPKNFFEHVISFLEST